MLSAFAWADGRLLFLLRTSRRTLDTPGAPNPRALIHPARFEPHNAGMLSPAMHESFRGWSCCVAYRIRYSDRMPWILFLNRSQEITPSEKEFFPKGRRTPGFPLFCPMGLRRECLWNFCDFWSVTSEAGLGKGSSASNAILLLWMGLAYASSV